MEMGSTSVVGCGEDLDDAVELVHGGCSGEHGLAPQHLPQDAAHRPDIHPLPSILFKVSARNYTLGISKGNGLTDSNWNQTVHLGVFCRAEKDLGCAVPARCNVVGQHRVARAGRGEGREGARQAKIAHFDQAVAVEQHVARLRIGSQAKAKNRQMNRQAGSYLHVTMQHSGCVHVFQRLEKLIHYVLFVYLFKNICANDCVQICIHEFENQVYVSVIICFQDVPKFNNIFVIIQFL
jgi:hypothetical protein